MKITKPIKFNQLSNADKRRVCKQVNRRYRGNQYSHDEKYNETKHLPMLVVRLFESHPFIFLCTAY